MRFAFDLDGTISAAPDVWRTIMRSLKAQGHDVFILTGAILGTPGGNPPWRLNQLQTLGVLPEDYTQLVIVTVDNHPDFNVVTKQIGLKKGEFCIQQDVKFMVEDSPVYLECIAEKSPHIVRVLVTNALKIEQLKEEVAHGR